MKKLLAIILAISMIPLSFSLASGADALWGDVDGDGVLTANDAAVTLQNVLQSREYIQIADVNADGRINSEDAAMILQKVLDSTYPFPVETASEASTEAPTEEPVTDDTTEATTEAPTESTTEATTESTTEATTESTTEATTESTETTTEVVTDEPTETTTASLDGVIHYDYELLPSGLSTDPYFTMSGDPASTDETKIRISGTNSLVFNVAEGANVYITAKHASNTTQGTRTLYLQNSSGATVGSRGYEMGVDPVEALFAVKLPAGQYSISSSNHINVVSVRVTFEDIEITTETTTLREVPSEITTTGNRVEVSNFSELKSAVSNGNTDIYIQNDINCTDSITLNKTNANINIIGVTQSDGTAPSLDFAEFRDSATSAGSGRAGLRVTGSGYSFENIIVENAPDCGMRITGSGSGNCFVKNCIFRYNNNSGISVTSGGANNTFIAVDSYRNGDIANPGKCGDDADGFSVKLEAGENNYFYNCRAWENSDDGWDSYDRGTAVGRIDYIECLAWNNGNPNVFTGEYDYINGYPLDKGLLYVQQILREYPDFEEDYNNRTVTEWPRVTITLYGNQTRTYEYLLSDAWGGNPNGFKFGSAATPSSSYRYVENCIAFDHVDNAHQTPAKGYDQNNGSARYDIVNGLSFDNQQNYWMDKMTALSQTGTAISFNGGQGDATNSTLTLTTPSAAEQEALRATVHQYRDDLYDLVYNDIIPGIRLCDVF